MAPGCREPNIAPPYLVRLNSLQQTFDLLTRNPVYKTKRKILLLKLTMNILIIFNVMLIHVTSCIKTKTKNFTSIDEIKKKIILEHEVILSKVPANQSEVKPVKITNIVLPKIHPVTITTAKTPPVMISPSHVAKWAQQLSNAIYDIDERVVRRQELYESFSDINSELRNGTAIVNKMADILEDLLRRRARAAEDIMRKAEQLSKSEVPPPPDYAFDRSIRLDQVKKKVDPTTLEEYEIGLYCRAVRKVQLTPTKHFDAKVSLDYTSVQVAAEVFDCNPKVLKQLYWSEGLLKTFQTNYAQDSTIDFQYFCSAHGFLRHYPAALWDDMFKLKVPYDSGEDADTGVYDCRLRPWYVSAAGAPRDILILLDASGSMHNSSNKITGEQFTLALLNALTDDDRVNVLRFNVVIESPIACFNDKLVSANHVNTAAMMAAIQMFNNMTNVTYMRDVLEYSVGLLKDQRKLKDRPRACQQAIVLLTDSMYENFTDLMRHLDREGSIRLFTLWLHDQYGLRDNTRAFAESVSCNRDGYFAELITQNDVTQQVLKILQVLERPLVWQRKNRLTVFSDLYANVEDPRRSEYYWQTKENTEQGYRYRELKRHKEILLSSERLLKDHLRQEALDKYGHYYEGEDLKYRLKISVSVPVFEHTTSENITIQLDEENQRNSTRTYPVNRLLGVAGVDIPIDHLKLRLPYHLVGAGGSLFLLDHRGNVVIHDNLKPTFDGDILKPGYRTVDFLDLEQAAEVHMPRHYPKEWIKFRNSVIIDKENGNKTIYGKSIFENGMRAILEMREYHWKRILNHYTAVAVIPLYNRYHKVPDATFTKEIARLALKSLSQTDFVIQPDWLYCRHIEEHFDTREAEVLHFIRRRSDEPGFAMQKIAHMFSSIKPTLLDKNYICNEELMARLCKETLATDKWSRVHEKHSKHDCTMCELGSVTAFFASESGLTRWQQYHSTGSHAPPPEATWWSKGPAEPFYRRAAASPDKIVIHTPVSPVRSKRISEDKPPPFGIYSEWYTAAKVVGSPEQGIVGVAGFHFHPHHLKNLFSSITNFPTDEESVHCDGTTWSCVLIDEYGWVLAHQGNNYTEPPTDPLREHLATLYPSAMAALLDGGVFEINWLHDYQGVCFPPKNENLSSASAIVPSILISIWQAANLVLKISQELVLLIAVISTGTLVYSDTEFEKMKRRKRVRQDFFREKFEVLYNDSVLVNRTRFSACDRSRVIYILQDTPKAKAAMQRPPKACSWPVALAPVPDTNLLLVAVFNECPYRYGKDRPIFDPLHNEMYLELGTEVSRFKQGSAGKLACWRNRQTLPTRPPHVTCYPHEYHKEKGYRQCGPWIPDPDPEDGASNIIVSNTLLFIITLLLLNKYLSFEIF